MPHIVVQYTPNLESEVDITGLCRDIANVITGLKDEAGKPVFPMGGTRVLAYPAAHHAVADSQGDYGFCYINMRIATGRSDAMKKIAGEALLARAQARFSSVFEKKSVGVTVQIDEGAQVYDAKHSNLHTLFNK